MKTKIKIEAATPIRMTPQKHLIPPEILALMPPQRTPSAVLTEHIDALPPELKLKYELLYEFFDKDARSNLVCLYQAGEIIRACEDGDVVLRKPFRKMTCIAALAKALGKPERLLSDTCKLVTQFSREEYGDLIRQEPISWSHVRELLNVENRELRQELIQRVVAENLSADDLVGAILETRGWKPKPRGPGRSPKPPRNILHGLEKTISLSHAYCNAFEKALFSEAYDLPTQIQDAAPDTRTVAMRTEIEATITALVNVAAAANEKAQALRGVLPLCTYVLEASRAEPERTVIPTRPLRAVPQPLPQKS